MSEAILITGGSSGIGAATALYLAERGYRVYVTMRDMRRGSDLEAAAARRRLSLELLRLDVTDEASIEKALGIVLERERGIFGLVNNAGILVRGYFEDLSDAEMRRVFETNVFGTMAVTRAVLPCMRKARRGRIVVMSSAGGKIATMGASAYCASKFALEGFGEALAQELAPFQVYVSLVEPGFVKTELFGRNRSVASRALDRRGPYYQWFQRLERITDEQMDRVGSSPIDVARTVHGILTARRPRLRYVVGRRARLLIGLRRYVPGEVFERLWTKEMLRRVTQTTGS